MKLFNLTILFTITLSLFTNCSKDEDTTTVTPTTELPLIILEKELSEGYSFEDFNYDVYLTKEDYLNETNKIHTGNFDSNGEVHIYENISLSQRYYVDIYTDDNHLSNWYFTDFEEFENSIVFYASKGSYTPARIFENTKTFIGKWEFVNYFLFGLDDYTNLKTERTHLIINKDFTMTSHESYNDIDITVNYTFLGSNQINRLSITPSEEAYPASTEINYPRGESIGIYAQDVNSLSYINFAQQYALYTKVNN